MIGFILDDNNDLALDSLGNIRMEDGIETYRQHIVNILRLQQYEYPYDLTAGINWLEYVLGGKPNLAVWQAQVLGAIKSLSFVKSIKDWRYDVERSNGNLLFRLVVETDLGDITFEG